MKLSENWLIEADKLILQQSHDFNPALQMAKDLKEAGREKQGDNTVLAVFPAKIFEMWAKEAGIAFGDPAMHEVVARKMNDPDFAHFRVWGGRV